MSIEDKFVRCSKEKVRFDSPKGSLMIEQLWDIPLTSKVGAANLDTITVGLFKQLKEGETDGLSFVDQKKTSAERSLLQLKFDIARYIIEQRMAEANAAARAKADREHDQKIMEIIARKRDEATMSKSIEELEKLLSTNRAEPVVSE